MWQKLFLAFLLVLFLIGCAAVPRYWEEGKEGYRSPEGIATRTAIETAATPFVGEPWANIISTVAGLLAGGYAVHKRRKWLDTPAG